VGLAGSKRLDSKKALVASIERCRVALEALEATPKHLVEVRQAQQRCLATFRTAVFLHAKHTTGGTASTAASKIDARTVAAIQQLEGACSRVGEVAAYIQETVRVACLSGDAAEALGAMLPPPLRECAIEFAPELALEQEAKQEEATDESKHTVDKPERAAGEEEVGAGSRVRVVPPAAPLPEKPERAAGKEVGAGSRMRVVPPAAPLPELSLYERMQSRLKVAPAGATLGAAAASAVATPATAAPATIADDSTANGEYEL